MGKGTFPEAGTQNPLPPAIHTRTTAASDTLVSSPLRPSSLSFSFHALAELACEFTISFCSQNTHQRHRSLRIICPLKICLVNNLTAANPCAVFHSFTHHRLSFHSQSASFPPLFNHVAMHVPGNGRLLHRRQNGDPPPIPTAPGLSGGATATSDPSAAATSLLVNGSSGPAAATSAPGLVSDSTIATTSTPASSPTSNAAPAASSSATSSSDGSISLTTVIGACVGAFVGFLFLILVGVWCYKRTGKKGRRGGSRGHLSPLSDSRNARGNTERRSSRLEPWNKLGEKEVDVWEGMVPSPSTKGVITFPEPAASPNSSRSVDKLGTMFKSSPSLHSTFKSTSSDGHDGVEFGDSLAGSAQFAKYHPHLAEELAKTVTPSRAVAARQDTGPPISWDGETIHDDDTYMQMQPGRIGSSRLSSASEAMSPTVIGPKNTPHATSSEFHQWESAEVLEYNAGYTEAKNPFSDIETENRKSVNNPFFNAQGLVMKRRPSNPPNPFSDPLKRPFTHVAQDSNNSVSSTDRAMQSLIAALDISPEEVQERLRVASMQPSIQSTGSALEDDTSVAEFPLPPTQNRF